MTETSSVTVDYEPDPDFSWLEQDCFADEDPADHIQLEMVAYDEAGNIIGSLSGIDFLEAESDWRTGTFYRVGQLAGCEHLQEIARELGLPE